ncbi:rRNA maturation RNase YbeY [Balneolales bacterium ANBcel1]|nr:rRNA maturation RNase YbeY [Balneolales bacterium ANBcel1]
MNSSVSYCIFNESGISVPLDETYLKHVIKRIEEKESCSFFEIEVVFVDDDTILEMNRKYLGHDYVTDILTFPYEDHSKPLEGTLYCCAQQIARQAAEHGEPFDIEVKRVVIHGLLHLVGYDDASEAEKHDMRRLENFYLG